MNVMRVVFHIGMGKTGTSSIQKALDNSEESGLLAAQKTAYLGMWFSFLGPEYRGVPGFDEFMKQCEVAPRDKAEQFMAALKRMAARNGAETFIISNESLFARVDKFTSFFQELKKITDISLVGYLRHPADWLPSAFTQWGIRHKTQAGALRPISEAGRQLILQYGCTRAWLSKFADVLTIREYRQDRDVVTDFANSISIELSPLSERSLERGEPADLLLRALFNDRFPGQVLPDRFNKMVINSDRQRIPSVSDMSELCFHHDEISAIIAEKRAIFEFIREQTGLDFIDEPVALTPPPDSVELQRRLIDFLTEITLQQAIRLEKLERKLNDLSDRE